LADSGRVLEAAELGERRTRVGLRPRLEQRHEELRLEAKGARVAHGTGGVRFGQPREQSVELEAAAMRRRKGGRTLDQRLERVRVSLLGGEGVERQAIGRRYGRHFDVLGISTGCRYAVEARGFRRAVAADR